MILVAAPIIAAYALYHLSNTGKVAFLKELLYLLNDGGIIYIGDIAFQTKKGLDVCRKQAGEEWDEDARYQ